MSNFYFSSDIRIKSGSIIDQSSERDAIKIYEEVTKKNNQINQTAHIENERNILQYNIYDLDHENFDKKIEILQSKIVEIEEINRNLNHQYRATYLEIDRKERQLELQIVNIKKALKLQDSAIKTHSSINNSMLFKDGNSHRNISMKNIMKKKRNNERSRTFNDLNIRQSPKNRTTINLEDNHSIDFQEFKEIKKQRQSIKSIKIQKEEQQKKKQDLDNLLLKMNQIENQIQNYEICLCNEFNINGIIQKIRKEVEIQLKKDTQPNISKQYLENSMINLKEAFQKQLDHLYFIVQKKVDITQFLEMFEIVNSKKAKIINVNAVQFDQIPVKRQNRVSRMSKRNSKNSKYSAASQEPIKIREDNLRNSEWNSFSKFKQNQKELDSSIRQQRYESTQHEIIINKISERNTKTLKKTLSTNYLNRAKPEVMNEKKWKEKVSMNLALNQRKKN